MGLTVAAVGQYLPGRHLKHCDEFVFPVDDEYVPGEQAVGSVDATGQ